MEPNNESSRQQNPTLPPNSRIRIPEDTPVAIPCLQDAITACVQYFNDPHVLRAVIFFFSSVIRPRSPDRPLDQQQVLQRWTVRMEELSNPYHQFYRDSETGGRVDAIINQLHPLLTYQELQVAANTSLRGDPQMTGWRIHQGYVMVDRGYDWIVRCALECDVPEYAKVWLQLMYERQPYIAIDTPSYSQDPGTFPFMLGMWNAARLNGVEAMIPVIKFYLRQAMLVADLWESWVSADVGSLAERSCMPDYSWCVAAYKEMWQGFQKVLQDPFSEYPYQVRDQMKLLSYMRVFEECWEWVHAASGDVHVGDFSGHDVRARVHNDLLAKVRDEFKDNLTNIAEILEQAFGSYDLILETRVIGITHVSGYPYLDEVQYLEAGLCRSFYPHLPGMTQEQYDARYPVSDSDSISVDWSDTDFEDDEYELVDIEIEAYGARLNLADFTVDKQPGADDICTICQTEVSLGDSNQQRCMIG
ncbi:hypothetical protein EKO04_003978 [Ascochyta lentis]|uniref:Uncharacterized protein n=1 Tax=Ascochyta lentis TaxID=205686 RepID=A0A8H7MK24_9PLEO|nr:hypothetical protein EKO04_003978 [Ascochyta lentis]